MNIEEFLRCDTSEGLLLWNRLAKVAILFAGLVVIIDLIGSVRLKRFALWATGRGVHSAPRRTKILIFKSWNFAKKITFLALRHDRDPGTAEESRAEKVRRNSFVFGNIFVRAIAFLALSTIVPQGSKFYPFTVMVFALGGEITALLIMVIAAGVIILGTSVIYLTGMAMSGVVKLMGNPTKESPGRPLQWVALGLFIAGSIVDLFTS